MAGRKSEKLRNPPNRIREIREARGWTLDELAKRMHSSPQAVQRYETGQRQTTLGILAVAARAFGVEVASLLPAKYAVPASAPMRYVVASRFSENAPRWDEPPVNFVAAPYGLKRPEECFAALVGDDSADRLGSRPFPRGAVLFVRSVDKIRQPMVVGARVVVARFMADKADGRIMEVLAGKLDRGASGDLFVKIASSHGEIAGSVTVRDAPEPESGGMDDVSRAFAHNDEPAQSYTPLPGDRGEILGVVERADYPE